MTVEAVREQPTRKPRRTKRAAAPVAEAELEIFDCPACGRPRSAESDPCLDCAAQEAAAGTAVIEAAVEPVEPAIAAEAGPDATLDPERSPAWTVSLPLGNTGQHDQTPAKATPPASAAAVAVEPEPDGHPDRPDELRSSIVEAIPEARSWRPRLPSRPARPARPTRAPTSPRPALAIGEPDANIFGCPSCARPLIVGTARCPDCSTRLIAGVRATRAVTFVAAGLLVGVLIGGGLVGAVALLGRPAAVAAVGATASTPFTAPAPSAPGVVPPTASAPATSGPVASTAPPPVDPAVPGSALSALRQSLLVNQRLVTDAAKLSAAMAATKPASAEIARALRQLAADAAFGDRIAPDVGAWSDATGVSADLVDAYAAIGATARAGLASSLANTRAYLKAGRAMQLVMADLAEIDEAARALGAAAGMDLPPVAPVPAAD